MNHFLKRLGVILLPLISSFSFATVGGPYVIEILGVEKNSPKIVFVDGWRDGAGDPSTRRTYDPATNKIATGAKVNFDTPYPEQVLNKLRKNLRPIKETDLASIGLALKITLVGEGELSDEHNRKPYRALRVTFTNPKMAAVATVTLWDYRKDSEPLFTAYKIPEADLSIIKIHYVGVPYETGYTVDRLLFFKAGRLTREHQAKSSRLFSEKIFEGVSPKH